MYRGLVRGGLLSALLISVGAAELYEVDGLIAVEAEHASSRGQWKEKGPDRNSSGTFMAATSAGSRTDALSFPIDFRSSGPYWVYLRARAVDGKDGDWTRHNDAFVMLNGESCVVRVGTEWREVEGIRSSNRVYFFLANEGKLGSHPPEWAMTPVAVRVPSAGKHTLRIGARSSEYEIDKIVLLNDSRPDAKTLMINTNPPETNSPESVTSNVTITPVRRPSMPTASGWSLIAGVSLCPMRSGIALSLNGRCLSANLSAVARGPVLLRPSSRQTTGSRPTQE